MSLLLLKALEKFCQIGLWGCRSILTGGLGLREEASFERKVFGVSAQRYR
jgi:hypothetical protein